MNHNECKEDEIWVGNIQVGRDLSYLQNLKYRIGDIAYCIEGKKLDSNYMRPLFVKKESFSEYNRIMTARMRK